MTLQELQSKIGEWHRGAFPDASAGEIVDKADEEMGELREAFELHPLEMQAEESADIVIAVLAFCAKQGIDLAAEVEKKHAVNLTREWRRDDAGRWKRLGVRREMRDGKE